MLVCECVFKQVCVCVVGPAQQCEGRRGGWEANLLIQFLPMHIAPALCLFYLVIYLKANGACS